MTVMQQVELVSLSATPLFVSWVRGCVCNSEPVWPSGKALGW